MNAIKPHSMKILPGPPEACSVCATDHKEHDPHNYWSMFYQVHFKMRYGRDATHADCVAHLPLEQRELYRQAIGEPRTVNGVRIKWSDPPEGVEPIAEPYATR